MGINTGYCNVGNFGSDQRITYTIIGGEVNVAQRLESAAAPGGILMPYETYAHAQDMINVKHREVVAMKGINRDIKVYSVVGRKNKETVKKRNIANPEVEEITDFEKLKNETLELKKESHFLKNELAMLKKQLNTVIRKP